MGFALPVRVSSFLSMHLHIDSYFLPITLADAGIFSTGMIGKRVRSSGPLVVGSANLSSSSDTMMVLRVREQ